MGSGAARTANYALARALVFDAVAPNRASTRNVLLSLGFRQLTTVFRLNDLRSACAEATPDLMILDVSDQTRKLCEFMVDLRHGLVGTNPFSVVIATSWDMSATLISQAIGAGADDILLRPFSIRQIAERIRQQMESRKGFVVTADYIGPDRRRDPERGGTGDLIEVPNTLRLRAVEGRDPEETAMLAGRAIDRAREAVSRERLRRLAFQVGVLAEFAAEAAAERDPRALAAEALKVTRVVRELRERAETCTEAALADLCETAARVAGELSEEPDAPGRNIDLLRKLAGAMGLIVEPGRARQSQTHDLKGTMARIRARGRTY